MDKKNVLIIEDETALLYALNAELSTAGFKVSTSADGKEGLEQMKKQKPDFIILDIWLPTLSGIDILEAREKDPELKKIPVLVISNSDSEKVKEKARDFGVLEYLVKTDHSLEEISKKIKKILES